MLKIAICGKSRSNPDYTKQVINNLVLKLRCSSRIVSIYSTAELAETISKDPFCYDIMIFDCENPNSYELAGAVRQENLLSSLVFITTENISLHSLLKYRPSGVITDTADAKKIFNGVKTAFSEQRRLQNARKNACFIAKTREKLLKINHTDIDYFENRQRVVTLYGNGGVEQISFYATLENVYESLPKNQFIMCHQSMIVNVSSIKTIDRTNKLILLNCGKAVEISKRHYTEVLTFFESYYMVERCRSNEYDIKVP